MTWRERWNQLWIQGIYKTQRRLKGMTDKEKRKIENHKYYLAHKKQNSEACKRWRQNNKEKVNAYMRKYRAKLAQAYNEHKQCVRSV
jgi:hypothetical protein